METMPSYDKAPAAILNYGFDWSDWLTDDDTIASAVWTVPAGLTKVDDDLSDTETVVVLSGGTLDEIYSVKCAVTTSLHFEDTRTMKIKIVEK